MNRLTLMSALCLTACGSPDPAPVIPPELLRQVEVICPAGTASRALGQCAVMLRQGLNEANSKLAAIGEIYTGPQ